MAGWRPTKLQERHIELLDDYVSECWDKWEKFRKSESTTAMWGSESWGHRLNVRLPTFAWLQLFFKKASILEKNKDLRVSSFAIKDWRTKWAKLSSKELLDKNEELLVEFYSSLEELLRLQEEMLLNWGVSNQYWQVITKLMLSSNHWYSDKLESEVKHSWSIDLWSFFDEISDKKDKIVK